MSHTLLRYALARFAAEPGAACSVAESEPARSVTAAEPAAATAVSGAGGAASSSSGTASPGGSAAASVRASVAGSAVSAAGEPASASVRKKRWPWVVAVSALAVLGLAVLGLAAYAGGADPGQARRRAVAVGISMAPPAGERRFGNGADDVTLERVGADGALIVTVTGIRCGVEAVGPIELRRRSHQQFCLVGVSVENAGREARLLDGGAQRAVDGHGRAYAVVGRAAAFLNERASSLLDPIPGGSTVRGVLPFEIPARAHLAALLAHESAGSRGARIPLP